MTVYELAKQLQVRGGWLLERLRQLDVPLQGLDSEVNDEVAQRAPKLLGLKKGLLGRLKRRRALGTENDYEAVDEELYALAMAATPTSGQAHTAPVHTAMPDTPGAEPTPEPAFSALDEINVPNVQDFPAAGDIDDMATPETVPDTDAASREPDETDLELDAMFADSEDSAGAPRVDDEDALDLDALLNDDQPTTQESDTSAPSTTSRLDDGPEDETDDGMQEDDLDLASLLGDVETENIVDEPQPGAPHVMDGDDVNMDDLDALMHGGTEKAPPAPQAQDRSDGLDLASLLADDVPDNDDDSVPANAGLDLDALLAGDAPKDGVSLEDEGIDLTSILGDDVPDLPAQPVASTSKHSRDEADEDRDEASTGPGLAERFAGVAALLLAPLQQISVRAIAIITMGMLSLALLVAAFLLYRDSQNVAKQAAGWLNQGVVYYNQGLENRSIGNEDRAKQQFQRARGFFQAIARSPQRLPQTAEARYRLGDVNHALGEYREAINSYQAAIQIEDEQSLQEQGYPDDQPRREAELRIGEALLHLRSYDQARQQLEEVGRRYANSPVERRALMLLGRVFHDWAQATNDPSKYGEAIKALDGALRLTGEGTVERALVYERLARTWLDFTDSERHPQRRRENLEKVVRQYDAGLEVARQTDTPPEVMRRILLGQADALFTLEQWSRVEENARAVLALSPTPEDAIGARERLARALLQQERPAEALAEAERIVAAFIADARVSQRASAVGHTLRGDAFHDLGNYPDMYDAYGEAVKAPLDVGPGGIYTQRAEVRMAEYLFQTARRERRHDMLKNAIDRMRELLVRYPESDGAYYVTFQLGNCYHEWAKMENQPSHYLEASGWYQRVIETRPFARVLDPGDRFVELAHFRRAECHDAVGQHAQARDAYWLAINEFPNSEQVPHAILRRGEMFHQLGEFETAIQIHHAYLEEGYPDPNSEVRLRLGEMRLGVYDYDGGRAALAQITSASPVSTLALPARRLIASSFLRQAQSAPQSERPALWRQGVQAWQEVTQQRDSEPDDLLKLARAQEQAQQPGDAIQTLQRTLGRMQAAVQDATQTPEIRAELARLQLTQQQPGEALETLAPLADSPAASEPAFGARVHQLQAQAHEALDQIPQAIEDYEAVRRLHPGSAMADTADTHIQRLTFTLRQRDADERAAQPIAGNL